MKIGTIVGNKIAHVPVVGRFTEAYRFGARHQRMLRNQPVDTAAVPPPEPVPELAVAEPPPPPNASPTHAEAGPTPQTVAEWLDSRWTSIRPLDCFPAPSAGPRLTVVTDAVDAASLFGGVGTSLVLGALAANHMRAVLRLVTRTVAPDPGAVGRVLAANGVRLEGRLEVVHVPHRGGRELPLADDDVFLTTSWWTTRSMLSTVHRERVAYLLQEDERMFYPVGDDRLRCEQTLHEPDVLTIVNSRLLFDHLLHGPEPIPAMADRAVWFEPAFPAAADPVARSNPSGKRRLFFYARPHHLRNLFCCGLEALSDAIADGTFQSDEWEICLVGKDMPDLVFPRGVQPRRVEGLSWSQYQDFVRTMDAGFVLMDTPHPSYPPLDLAAGGAAVLTNSRGNKQDLSHYSANISAVPPTREALRAGLAALARTACNDEARAAAVRDDSICRDWSEALGPVVERIARHFGRSPLVTEQPSTPLLRVA
jgi:hypothetical protein